MNSTLLITRVGVILGALILVLSKNGIYLANSIELTYAIMAVLGFLVGFLFKTKSLSSVRFLFLYSFMFFLMVVNSISFDVQAILEIVILCGGLFLSLYFSNPKVLIVSAVVYIVSTLAVSNYIFSANKVYTLNTVVEERIYEFIGYQYDYFPRKDGKVKVVELWFVDCAPCRSQLVEMEAIKKKYKQDPNVSFYTMNVANDSEDRIISLFKKLGVSGNVALDTLSYFSSLTGHAGYPQVLLIDRNNHLRHFFLGYNRTQALFFRYWLTDEINDLKEEQLTTQVAVFQSQ